MSRKPTLVLVPGSWHGPGTWEKVVSLLQAQQHRCIPVALPSTSPDPSVSFLNDIEAVRDAIVAETTQGNDVVVVVHSYGGAVGASAIKDLTRPKEAAADETASSGHVIGIVMLASGFVVTGISFMEGYGGKPPPSWRVDEDSGFAILVADPMELFYHDLPKEEAEHWVSKLEKQSLKALFEGGEHAYSGWKDVPVWYLSTTEDHALPVEAQRMFLQIAKDAGANITSRELPSSHSPMLSRPKESADFIVEAVASFQG